MPRQATPAAAEVRAYLAALPPAVRQRLQQIRAIVRATAPAAVEHFSYRMPGFRLEGKTLVWYAAFKSHTSLFPITPALLRAHRIDVAGYVTSKGTIQFPLDAPLPAALIKRLVKARAVEVRAPRS
ncbi:MAG TPA: DUF1801 domain-containing protein [Polyangia bacterium]|nr:DUF1801 domain-containing protein [Polyangia bacterium]